MFCKHTANLHLFIPSKVTPLGTQYPQQRRFLCYAWEQLPLFHVQSCSTRPWLPHFLCSAFCWVRNKSRKPFSYLTIRFRIQSLHNTSIGSQVMSSATSYHRSGFEEVLMRGSSPECPFHEYQYLCIICLLRTTCVYLRFNEVCFHAMCTILQYSVIFLLRGARSFSHHPKRPVHKDFYISSCSSILKSSSNLSLCSLQ